MERRHVSILIEIRPRKGSVPMRRMNGNHEHMTTLHHILYTPLFSYVRQAILLNIIKTIYVLKFIV